MGQRYWLGRRLGCRNRYYAFWWSTIFSHGVKSFAVNGEAITPTIQNGYAVITREWKTGDRIELELPMEPQRVVADTRIKADQGLVALKYGPLIYNAESADNHNIDRRIGDAALRTEWRPDLLDGVVVITGKWADGSDLLAVPNYARMNRVGQPHDYPVEPRAPKAGQGKDAEASAESKVWI